MKVKITRCLPRLDNWKTCTMRDLLSLELIFRSWSPPRMTTASECGAPRPSSDNPPPPRADRAPCTAMGPCNACVLMCWHVSLFFLVFKVTTAGDIKREETFWLKPAIEWTLCFVLEKTVLNQEAVTSSQDHKSRVIQSEGMTIKTFLS